MLGDPVRPLQASSNAQLGPTVFELPQELGLLDLLRALDQRVRILEAVQARRWSVRLRRRWSQLLLWMGA